MNLYGVLMQYSPEFKTKIINEVQEVKSLSAVSRKHNIAASTISGWIKKENKKIEYKWNHQRKT